MSASLFRSKQYKSKKNLKHLVISAPLSAPLPVLPPPHLPVLPCVVVLVAKYQFHAENDGELLIEPRDYLKLVERPGNGWLKVQQLDKYDDSGLVPASYVDIAVNDVTSPVTIEWLQQYRHDDEDEVATQLIADEIELPVNQVYPVDVCIEQVLQAADTGRFWYLLKVVLSSDTCVYIGKCYHEFYDLHCQLLSDGVALPKLPQPLRTSTPALDKRLIDDLSTRGRRLDDYMKELIRTPAAQCLMHLFTFINNTTQVSACELQDAIVCRICPHSVEIHRLTSSCNTTAPLPPIDTLLLLTLSNTLVSYTSLIDGYDDDSDSDSDKEKSTHYSSNSESSEMDLIFLATPGRTGDDHALLTPTTPIIEEFESPHSPPAVKRAAVDYIKIKISLHNKEDDKIALRIKRTNLISIVYLKKLVLFKIYKDYNLTNHYKLEVDGAGALVSEEELLEYIKARDKVNLRLARSRVSH